MPVSAWQGVSAIMDEIDRLAPKSVLDLGVGFGKYGVLCRELLDARHGRCRPEQWQTRIVGYEAHRAYVNPCWHVYTCVIENDFTKYAARGFDLVLMIDSLEHLEPNVGKRYLWELVHQNKQVIVSVPNGLMEQGEVYGNAFEAHKWTFNGTEEFEQYEFKLIHQSVCTVVSIKGIENEESRR